ncbi:3'-5' exonuclease [Lactobacillaceae bacterium L1_55_11]|nr:3'-5' exonuclease [Lactobacillaceae bacterium L1_55_11]
MNFVAIDFETANHERHSAASLALAVVRDNQIVDQLYTLIKPETYFSRRNTQIHGLTAKTVAQAPKFSEIWPKISPLFTENQLVVAHNAQFDSGVLKATLSYYGMEEPHYQLIDTVQTSRHFFPEFPNHKLNTVADELDIDLEHHHNALDDAVAAAEILIYQDQQFGDQAIKPFVRYK